MGRELILNLADHLLPIELYHHSKFIKSIKSLSSLRPIYMILPRFCFVEKSILYKNCHFLSMFWRSGSPNMFGIDLKNLEIFNMFKFFDSVLYSVRSAVAGENLKQLLGNQYLFNFS
jgi:hypothetical protein